MKPNKEQKDLKFFGFGLAVIAVFFAAMGTHKHGFGWPPKVQLICALIFVTVTALKWQALRPGYKGWMAVAHVIGAVVTTGILSVVFYCVFTPVALILRLFRRDHLDRTIDRAAASYWHARPEVERNAAEYLQQY